MCRQHCWPPAGGLLEQTMFNQTAAFPIIPAGPKSGNLPWLSTQSITELNKFTHSPTMMQIREGRARSWNFSTQLVVHLLNQVTYVEDFSVAADSLSVFAKKKISLMFRRFLQIHMTRSSRPGKSWIFQPR